MLLFPSGDVVEGIGGIIRTHRAEAFVMRKQLVQLYVGFKST